MTAPCIITVAITGSLPTKADNPAVPTTIHEQIESTQEAFEAGATLVHCHVRDDAGKPTSDPERFGLLPQGLRKHCPGMIVQLSTGGRGRADQPTRPGAERGGHDAGADLFVFPANFRGRNLPDVSLNADPFTGYTVFYTSVTGFAVQSGVGGTSFVASQLAGITALLAQNARHRLGLLNPLPYGLALRGGTEGPNAVLNTISTGDNWFYSGRDGYSPAAGLGTLNVGNLATRIKQLVPPD